MDIHAPSGPVESLKDFALHILIVTTGILIAFSLEGIREVWHEHKLVSETRQSLREELHFNQGQLAKELSMVEKANSDLDVLLTHFHDLGKTPAELNKKVLDTELGFHFFRTRAWDTALESGVLAHMERPELLHFDDAYLSVKNYQDAEKLALPDWVAVRAYFESHRTYGPSELVIAEEKLRTLRIKTGFLDHLGGSELAPGLKSAVDDK